VISSFPKIFQININVFYKTNEDVFFVMLSTREDKVYALVINKGTFANLWGSHAFFKLKYFGFLKINC
jgi:hypothetical protein